MIIIIRLRELQYSISLYNFKLNNELFFNMENT